MSLSRCEWPEGCSAVTVTTEGADPPAGKLCSYHARLVRREHESATTLSRMIASANRDRPWIDRHRRTGR